MINERRIMDIEVSIAHCEKTIEELNKVVIEQAMRIDALIQNQKKLTEMFSSVDIKLLSEEVPPPHY